MNQQNEQSMTIEDLAVIVKTGFDDISERMVTKDELKNELAQIRSEMVTKEQLTNEIGRLRSDMIDYIAKQNLDLRGDLVVLMRGEDRKLLALIEVMVEKNLLSKSDANRITKLEPFPQAI